MTAATHAARDAPGVAVCDRPRWHTCSPGLSGCSDPAAWTLPLQRHLERLDRRMPTVQRCWRPSRRSSASTPV